MEASTPTTSNSTVDCVKRCTETTRFCKYCQCHADPMPAPAKVTHLLELFEVPRMIFPWIVPWELGPSDLMSQLYLHHSLSAGSSVSHLQHLYARAGLGHAGAAHHSIEALFTETRLTRMSQFPGRSLQLFRLYR